MYALYVIALNTSLFFAYVRTKSSENAYEPGDTLSIFLQTRWRMC